MPELDQIFLGAYHEDDQSTPIPQYLNLRFANRHGLITGATGTGKTVTMQVLAEAFSQAGVPVFCADIKGDLSGIAKAAQSNDKLNQRAASVGLNDYQTHANPVIFWDIFGELGHPVRTTISEMGPLLLSRLMDLTDAQEGVLNIAFRLADEQGLLLLDLKDLQSLLVYIGEQASELSTRYGNVSKASVGAIQRALLVLEQQGGDKFFGEPALKLSDMMRTTVDGRGQISIMAAEKLMTNPRLYATFLLWLMSELFEQLPEIGDPDKPRIVFFFDEAHLLFDSAPDALIQRIEQVVRLIRSKGVGIYFVSQNPLDVPESVLAQLGNRIQHALRAYTPRETKAVKTAASTFRANPAFDSFTAIQQLATGEALVSVLEGKAIPSIVQKTMIRPPASQIGPLTDQERQQFMATSPVSGQYDTLVDRESAYEMLHKAAQEKAEMADKTEDDHDDGGIWGGVKDILFGGGKSGRQSVAEAAIKSATRSLANDMSRSLTRQGKKYLRGVLGNLFGGNKTK